MIWLRRMRKDQQWCGFQGSKILKYVLQYFFRYLLILFQCSTDTVNRLSGN